MSNRTPIDTYNALKAKGWLHPVEADRLTRERDDAVARHAEALLSIESLKAQILRHEHDRSVLVSARTRAERKCDEARRALEKAEQLFSNVADQCDAWARESRDGGWSTHQVDANRKMAVMCRDEAAALRAISTGEGSAS
jgi:hypothetical protein